MGHIWMSHVMYDDSRVCYPIVKSKSVRVSVEVATISRLLENHRSLSQNIVSFIGLFCKRYL